MDDPYEHPNLSGLVRNVYVSRLAEAPNVACRPIPGGARIRLSLDLPKERNRAMIEEANGAVLEIELPEKGTLSLLKSLQEVAIDMGWLQPHKP